MQIQINEVSRNGTDTYIDATCGKTSAYIGFHSHGVQVCCKNASHKVWGGFGKHFRTIEEAMQNYRSAEMKAILEAAVEAAAANGTAH